MDPVRKSKRVIAAVLAFIAAMISIYKGVDIPKESLATYADTIFMVFSALMAVWSKISEYRKRGK